MAPPSYLSLGLSVQQQQVVEKMIWIGDKPEYGFPSFYAVFSGLCKRSFRLSCGPDESGIRVLLPRQTRLKDICTYYVGISERVVLVVVLKIHYTVHKQIGLLNPPTHNPFIGTEYARASGLNLPRTTRNCNVVVWECTYLKVPTNATVLSL